MIYIYRVRRLVKIVLDETSNPTDPMSSPHDLPNLQYCSLEFQKLSKRYTPQISRKILTIATGKNYLSIGTGKRGNGGSGQTLQVKSDGIILLTCTGFVSALGESIGNAVSIFIAFAALGVSIWAGLHQ
jgi:hypothetical protein